MMVLNSFNDKANGLRIISKKARKRQIFMKRVRGMADRLLPIAEA